jgi:hypothetical protein
LRRVDRKGGNRAANIEKMTEAKQVVSLNPPRVGLFPGEFFNNIGQLRSSHRAIWVPHSGHIKLAQMRDQCKEIEGLILAACNVKKAVSGVARLLRRPGSDLFPAL